MTASIPGWLAWPLITSMAIVIAARYVWFNSSKYEHYFNNTLALMLAAQLLREHAVEQFLSQHGLMTVTTAQHLSLVLVFFMAAEFMGFITHWARGPAEESKRRHRNHRLAAVALAAAFLAVTTRARNAGQLLEVSGGWDNVVAWGLYAVLPVALAVQIANIFIQDVRRPGAKPRERRVAALAIVISLAIGSTTLIAMGLELLEELGWVHSLDYRLWAHAFIFFWEAILTTAAAAIPVVLAVLTKFGQDPISRAWRQLQPLRSAMNAAAPGSHFEIRNQKPGRRKTPLQLHQTTIEIRDAILQLRPYFRSDDQHLNAFLRRHAVPAGRREQASFAFQLADAVRTKTSGAQPDPTDAAVVVKSRSTSLNEETTELLKLSKWWPHATSDLSATASPTNATKAGPR